MEVSSTRIVNEMNNISCTFLWSNKYISLSLSLYIYILYNPECIVYVKSNFRCRENIYIAYVDLRRLATEYVKNDTNCLHACHAIR